MCIRDSNSANRAFYSQDGYALYHAYNSFHPVAYLYNEDTLAPRQAVGTVIDIGCFVVQDNAGVYMRIGAASPGMEDSGMVSSLCIQELAA